MRFNLRRLNARETLDRWFKCSKTVAPGALGSDVCYYKASLPSRIDLIPGAHYYLLLVGRCLLVWFCQYCDVEVPSAVLRRPNTLPRHSCVSHLTASCAYNMLEGVTTHVKPALSGHIGEVSQPMCCGAPTTATSLAVAAPTVRTSVSESDDGKTGSIRLIISTKPAISAQDPGGKGPEGTTGQSSLPH